jgi:3-hydroxybutyryl-CoA dehydratase
MSDARIWNYSDIAVGMIEARDYAISMEVCDHFLAAFDDRNPIHVDDSHARKLGFPEKVMHGTLLNGFLSHFIGMFFPGRLSLLLSVDLRFAQPSHLGDVIRLEAVVSQKLDVRKVIVLDATFRNITRASIAARGRIQVMLTDEP